MELSRLPRSVRRITVLGHDTSGTAQPVTVYERPSKRAKGSRFLRPFESAVRRLADAGEASAAAYLARHRRSNRKKKDGWVRDLGLNTVKASRKGVKALKVFRLVGL